MKFRLLAPLFIAGLLTACTTTSKTPKYVGEWSGIDPRLNRPVALSIQEDGVAVAKDVEKDRTDVLFWTLDSDGTILFMQKAGNGEKMQTGHGVLISNGEDLVITSRKGSIFLTRKSSQSN